MLSKVFAVFDRPAADSVTAQLPFLGSAWPSNILVISYLLIVLKCGKMFMKNRQPFDIKRTIICYNVFQVIYNFLVSFGAFYYLFIEPKYNLSCMPTLSMDHPHKNMERGLTYAFFFGKIIDLLDTIFFVLRKSYKQITVLHVYHHVLMVSCTYWVIRIYGVGGQFTVMEFLNSFVHTVMYFYYLISAMYPGLKASLWWKKYITLMQIVQFFTLMSQAVYILVAHPDCEFPAGLQYMICFCSSVFIVMFSKFYIKAYLVPRTQKQM